MNELRPYLNENNPEEMMTKKDVKEMIVTTGTNKMHLLLGD